MKELFVGKIKIYCDVCCEVCREVIHNNLDCPVCGKEYASSDQYHDLFENTPRRIECECGAVFEANGNPYDPGTIWRQVKGETP